MADPCKENKFKILGQEIPYPETVYAVAGLLIFCVSVIVILYISLIQAGPEQRAWITGIVYGSDGRRLSKTEDARLVEVWTPSIATCQYVDKDKNGDPIPDDKWECVSDQKIRDFDSQVVAFPGVNGFRRHQVLGHGRTKFKEGWWWVINVTKGFSTEGFVASYSDFWGNRRDVYVEEINSHNSFVRSKESE